jgi:hypothetical protein
VLKITDIEHRFARANPLASAIGVSDASQGVNASATDLKPLGFYFFAFD